MTLYQPIGNDDLCAWQFTNGKVWVQTRSPLFARKLSQRSDGQRMAVGVSGGFLRTYEFKHTMAWAKRLIARYIQSEMPTNERFSQPAALVTSLNLPDGSGGRKGLQGLKTPVATGEIGMVGGNAALN